MLHNPSVWSDAVGCTFRKPIPNLLPNVTCSHSLSKTTILALLIFARGSCLVSDEDAALGFDPEAMGRASRVNKDGERREEGSLREDGSLGVWDESKGR